MDEFRISCDIFDPHRFTARPTAPGQPESGNIGLLFADAYKPLHHRGIDRPVPLAGNGSSVVLYQPEQADAPVEAYRNRSEKFRDRLLDRGGFCKDFRHSMLEGLTAIGTLLFRDIANHTQHRLHHTIIGDERHRRHLDPADLSRQPNESSSGTTLLSHSRGLVNIFKQSAVVVVNKIGDTPPKNLLRKPGIE